ncbi:GGDEF domain-containing protein [Deinococcus wulumuqiensis]|uniref:GGDEF domain-containing protein n=1 Tax=Deinococcus wulumuqiensis TaxID=980427 RepID=A0A345IIG3_9DEIO|nr:GGDEF domain-containing protein [Deinococcus wulumuqiensis]
MTPLRFPLPEARLRRRPGVYLALTLLTGVLQVLAALACMHDPPRLAAGVTGVALSAAMVGLSLRRPLPEDHIHRLAVTLALVWLMTEAALMVWHGGVLSPQQLTNAAITSALALTLLPPRQAVPVVAMVYGLLLVLVLTIPGSDLILLLMNMVLAGLMGFMSVYGRQVSVAQARSAWLQDLAFRDPLTGLANRHMADEELRALELAQGALAPEQSAGAVGDAALLILDLDDFKRINDSLGHARGDQALVHVARLIEGQLRPGDTAARWGGEEFLVILRGVSREQARAVGERMLQAVQNTPLPGFPHLTLSGGGAMLEEAPDHAALLDLADRRLYAAKHAGRARSVWSEDEVLAAYALFPTPREATRSRGP